MANYIKEVFIKCFNPKLNCSWNGWLNGCQKEESDEFKNASRLALAQVFLLSLQFSPLFASLDTLQNENSLALASSAIRQFPSTNPEHLQWGGFLC